MLRRPASVRKCIQISDKWIFSFRMPTGPDYREVLDALARRDQLRMAADRTICTGRLG